jgi:hypothetical protein
MNNQETLTEPNNEQHHEVQQATEKKEWESPTIVAMNVSTSTKGGTVRRGFDRVNLPFTSYRVS